MKKGTPKTLKQAISDGIEMYKDKRVKVGESETLMIACIQTCVQDYLAQKFMLFRGEMIHLLWQKVTGDKDSKSS